MATHPKFADSVLVPPERVAPAQIGRKPVPPLPDDSKLGAPDMLQGMYSGYTVSDTIRPGKAPERLAHTTKSSRIAPLGGALVQSDRHEAGMFGTTGIEAAMATLDSSTPVPLKQSKLTSTIHTNVRRFEARLQRVVCMGSS